MPSRPSRDQYFMGIAQATARRATCDRKHVGAVIVRDGFIVSTGYNGSMRGAAHCDDVGHLMENGHCVRTVHAEINAIVQAAAGNGGCKGATLYVTAFPCWSCAKAAVNAGITRIVYAEAYRPSEHVLRELYALGIILEQCDAAD